MKPEIHSVQMCNIYMPTKYSPQISYSGELNEVIAGLSIVINVSHCANIIIRGDFNSNVHHYGKDVEILQIFMHNYRLFCGLEYPVSILTYM